MLNLPQITLVTINCVNPQEGVKALRYSMREIIFAEAILITHEDIIADDVKIIKIEKLNSVQEYNDFLLGLIQYIDTAYALVIQDDGYVLNASNWNHSWLKYDMIGAVWPNEQDWICRQQTKEWMVGNWNRVGNGGFSLRSKKFMELSDSFESCLGFGEDAFLNLVKYNYMIDNGIKFAPVEVAKKFSMENNLENWPERISLEVGSTFGFHGKELLNSDYLINLKNG